MPRIIPNRRCNHPAGDSPSRTIKVWDRGPTVGARPRVPAPGSRAGWLTRALARVSAAQSTHGAGLGGRGAGTKERSPASDARRCPRVKQGARSRRLGAASADLLPVRVVVRHESEPPLPPAPGRRSLVRVRVRVRLRVRVRVRLRLRLRLRLRIRVRVRLGFGFGFGFGLGLGVQRAGLRSQPVLACPFPCANTHRPKPTGPTRRAHAPAVLY